jgi:gluconate 5-dehydrogenase
MVDRKQGKIINTCSIQVNWATHHRPPMRHPRAVKMLTKKHVLNGHPTMQVNGLVRHFATELTAALVDDEEFSGWLCKRTPAGR